MGNHAISGIAALVVLTFVALALAACSTPEQVVVEAEPVNIVAFDLPPGTPEFHGASIGDDALRARLDTE